MSKKILVLGGTGVIGTALIEDFKNKGYYVANISKENTNPLADINYLIDLRYCVGVDTDTAWDEIYMLSCYSTFDKMDPIYMENESDIIKYLLKNNTQADFYYMSSYAVLDETDYPTDSIRYQYRQSKIKAEKLLMVMSSLDYNVHSLRIPAVYGGRNNNRSIYHIIEKLKQNLPIDIKGDTKICYTQDIVDFYSDYTTRYREWNESSVSTLPAIDINLAKVVLHLKDKLKSISEITVELNTNETDIVNEVLKDID